MNIKDELIKYAKWYDRATMPEYAQTDEADLVQNVESYLQTEGKNIVLSDVMCSLPADDIDTAIRMLKVHAYSQEEMEEIGDDMTKIDDAFAFDHAVIIQLLGGALDSNDA